MSVNNVTFSSQCDELASQAGASQLVFVVKGLIMARDAGATNKAAARALWSTVSDETSNALSVLKRINGGLNAPKATDSQRAIRALWIAADDAEDFLSGLAGMGVKTAKQLQVLACPRKDPKAPSVKTAVEVFLDRATEEGFNEDLTPILVFIAERHAKQMQGLLEQAEAFQAGVLAEAKAKQAEIDAKQAKAEKAKAEKASKAAEKARIRAEEMAEIEKLESDAKSAQAKQEHTAKVARSRATHPKVRAMIEA